MIIQLKKSPSLNMSPISFKGKKKKPEKNQKVDMNLRLKLQPGHV